MIYLEDGQTYKTNNGESVTVTKTDYQGCLSFKGDNGMHYTIGGHTRDANLDIAKKNINWKATLSSTTAQEILILVLLAMILFVV